MKVGHLRTTSCVLVLVVNSVSHESERSGSDSQDGEVMRLGSIITIGREIGKFARFFLKLAGLL